MPQRAHRHWHIQLDWRGQPTFASIEHEHLTRPGVRHAHYWDRDTAYRWLRDQGYGELQAKGLTELLHERAQTTKSFDVEPRPVVEGRPIERKVWTTKPPA